MHLTKITLGSYLHFKKGLEIDLTYPSGHEKAGAPLEKVCFIGQSATGKTALLNLIKCCVCEDGEFNKTGIDKSAWIDGGVTFNFRLDQIYYSKVSKVGLEFRYYDQAGTEIPLDVFQKMMEFKMKDAQPWLINFPFCVVTPEIISQTQEATPVTFSSLPKIQEASFKERKIWDFDAPTVMKIWNIVFSEVTDYLQNFQKTKNEFFDRAYSNMDHAKAEFSAWDNWVKQNPNPILKLAEKYLTKILNHFCLDVETDMTKYQGDVASKDEMMHVIIKHKAGGQLPYDFLSSGTKQILLTAIPLVFLEPKNSVILFDQPETSIYPNLQCKLPEVFLDCAKNNNQFFFATHSPVVASAFDPWEVVELEFLEDGSVQRKEYFSGERLEKNYHTFPKLLRWDSIYKILFDLKTDGNDDRTQFLMKLVSLRSEIQAISDPKMKEAKFEEYKKLAHLLDWKTDARSYEAAK